MLYSKRTGRWRFLFEFAACALLSLATAHYRLWCRRGFQVTGSTVPDFWLSVPDMALRDSSDVLLCGHEAFPLAVEHGEDG